MSPLFIQNLTYTFQLEREIDNIIKVVSTLSLNSDGDCNHGDTKWFNVVSIENKGSQSVWLFGLR